MHRWGEEWVDKHTDEYLKGIGRALKPFHDKYAKVDLFHPVRDIPNIPIHIPLYGDAGSISWFALLFVVIVTIGWLCVLRKEGK